MDYKWVGDADSDIGGRLGLWQVCQKDDLTDSCTGRLEELLEMQSIAFQVATVFCGLAVATSVLAICCLLLMVFMKSTTVFHICGWMQMLSGEFCRGVYALGFGTPIETNRVT
uniref:Uncharacterized protein n=1 Tax=Anopheles melas TaxID=34690 RepID=A0A182TNW4_9DIPT